MNPIVKYTIAVAILLSAKISLAQENINVRYLYSALNDQQTMLQWAVENGNENYTMVIQRSSDGVNFQDYSEVSGRPTSYEMVYYHWDKNPLPGSCYYRIKIVRDNEMAQNVSETTDIENDVTLAQK